LVMVVSIIRHMTPRHNAIKANRTVVIDLDAKGTTTTVNLAGHRRCNLRAGAVPAVLSGYSASLYTAPSSA
jgi:hypothetical protein